MGIAGNNEAWFDSEDKVGTNVPGVADGRSGNWGGGFMYSFDADTEVNIYQESGI